MVDRAVWGPPNSVCGSRTDSICTASFSPRPALGQAGGPPGAPSRPPQPTSLPRPCWLSSSRVLRNQSGEGTPLSHSESCHEACSCFPDWDRVVWRVANWAFRELFLPARLGITGSGSSSPSATFPVSRVHARKSRSVSTAVLFLGKCQFCFSNKLRKMIAKQRVCSRR